MPKYLESFSPCQYTGFIFYAILSAYAKPFNFTQIAYIMKLLKIALVVLSFAFLFSGCEKELVLMSVTIDKIEMYSYPLTNNGVSWDPSVSGSDSLPDPFMTITEDTTTSLTSYEFVSNVRTDATPGNAISFSTQFPHTINFPDNTYSYGVYDQDGTVVNSEYMSGLKFKFSKYQEVSPATLELSTSSLTLKFYLTWNYQ